jgi:mono/diheme cytochrome c family protein
MKRLVLWVAAGAAAFSAAAQVAQLASEAPPAVAAATVAVPSVPPAPSVEAGRRAYTSTCARCHGLNLAVTSSAYFDLRTFPKDGKGRFIQSVTHGTRQMPAWGGVLQPEGIESIWLYVGSVNRW